MSVREALAGRHLLITGATGFLGKVLLERILVALPDTRVTLLVRPKGADSALLRVGKLLAHHPVFATLRHSEQHVSGRLRVWEGGLDDLSNPPSEALDVDLVLHLASRVDFEPTPQHALADNVVGSQNIARLAARTRGRRLLYVSTAYVAGTGSRTVGEDPCQLGDTTLDAETERLEALVRAVDGRRGKELLGERATELGFANGYTLTKAMAEQYVTRWPGLHTTVVRPAVIEAAMDTPYRGFHEGFRTCAPLTWLAIKGLCRIPAKPDLKLDLVPVDEVARGLLLATASALTDGDSGAIWQLGTSAVNPHTMDRLTELVELAARTHGGVDGEALSPWSGWLGIHPTGGRTRLPGQAAHALKTAAPWLGRWRRPANQAARSLTRAQRAADLFAPFIVDTDHAFRCDRALAATAGLSGPERALFGVTLDKLDWREWWLEAQYPGLQKHCYRRPVWDTTSPPWAIETVRRIKEAV